ncbi:hypothetical protein MRX96_056022 [Rhipicephalus microplus]
MSDEQFACHFRLSNATVLWVRDEVADGTRRLRCALSGAAEVCAQRFFTTGPFKSSVGGKETFAVTQTAVECQRRDPSQVNSLPENSGGEGSREGGISSV